MNNDLNLHSSYLARGQLQRLVDANGIWVQCLGGRLWLTQENDPRDIVLDAGEEARIERGGVSIVSALSDARFVLLHEAVPPPTPAAGRGAPARV